MTPSRIHLSVVQPIGYVHSLGFVDQARYLRWQLRRCGAEVTMAKNRLREDAVNIVMGAHLGFDPTLRRRNACVFLNLEQLGSGGAAVGEAYLQLLKTSAVVDYDAANVQAYATDASDVPIIAFGHAAYLDRGDCAPLDERPIRLLFFGSVNERRRRIIQRIEDCGVQVTMFDGPLYGPERDVFIRQARAVLNCSFYPSGRFEQVRVAHCLSLGTPVIAERNATAASAWRDTLTWLDEGDWTDFFARRFSSSAWLQDAAAQLDRFRLFDPLETYAELLAFTNGFAAGFAATRPRHPWQPTRIRLDSGGGYRPGWLNLGRQLDQLPDLVGDLGEPIKLPQQGITELGAALLLEAGAAKVLDVGDEPARTQDLDTFVANALNLLAEGGELLAEVPLYPRPGVRSLDEAGWRALVDGYARMGLLDYRFELLAATPLDAQGRACAPEALGPSGSAVALSVVLRKRSTTARERMLVRSEHVTFGDLDEDAEVQSAVPTVPAAAFEPGAPQVEEQGAILAPVGRILELHDDVSRVAALVDAGQHDDALRYMASRVADTFLQDRIAHHALYYPGFDRQIARMADLLADQRPRMQPCAMRENHLIIATELYRIGGHSKLVEELARELPNPVLVLTDLFGTRASQPEQSAWIDEQYCMAQVIDLRSGTLWQRTEALSDFVRRLQPRSIWYFNHHQDPVPFVATLALAGPRKVLVHHCDHNPSLGATLRGLVHVDITDTLRDECSAHLGRSTELLRLYVADQGVKAFPRIAGTDYSVVTAGRSGKFSRSGPLSLSRIVATALTTVRGRHYHIGPLDQEWIDQIGLELRSHGLDPGRFVPLGSVTSLWATLHRIDAAVYIGSAPVSGGRGAVEAQGCGMPVLPFTGFESGSLLADFSSYADRALGWDSLHSLADQLRGIGDRHQALSVRARDFYEQEFTRTRFGHHVRVLAGCDSEALSVAA